MKTPVPESTDVTWKLGLFSKGQVPSNNHGGI